MYKTIYRSAFRVRTIQEAIQMDIPSKPTEMFLWLIDVYDLIMKGHQSPALCKKIKKFLIKNYKSLHVPIPGCLLGWTHSMFVFVIYLHLLTPSYEFSEAYVKRHRLRLYENPDPQTWSWDTYSSMLDLISLKWDDLPQTFELEQLLLVLWSLAKKFCLFIHTKDVLSVDNHTYRVAKTKYHVRLSPEAIVSILSRFVGFQFHGYTVVDVQVGENNIDHFLTLEKRHLVSRKFRENLCSWMWDHVILIGDKDIASHDQLGENVSSFTCLFKRNPAGQITNMQRVMTYSPYEEITDVLREFLHLHFIEQHFLSVYNISFLKFFVVFDIFKHEKNIKKCQVPLVLKLQGKYHVHFHNTVYRGGTIGAAFVVWLFMIKTYLQSKPYNMDFSLLTQMMFESLSDEETVEGYYTLHDEDL